MTKPADTMGGEAPFDLDRFITAQEEIYRSVRDELRNGQKRAHWMWFVFPQIDGLGFSSTTMRYSIKSIEEARAYLKHPVLGPRLMECSELVAAVYGKSASAIFGYPDDLKLKSSMTLFASVSEPGSVFARVLDKYFKGERDEKTLEILERFKAAANP